MKKRFLGFNNDFLLLVITINFGQVEKKDGGVDGAETNIWHNC